jgi:sterol desaturase/sphingolipid hydroxylase (fatty acid hydroxylase superfamily)
MAVFQSLLQASSSVFGAVRIPADQIYELEKSAPNLMVYALPVVFAFTLLEGFLSHTGEHKTYEKKETIGSLLIGLGNLAVNLMMKVVLLFGALWIYNVLPWRMELNWWMLAPCFVLYDCCSYWSHRTSHFNRFFWATHVVHHSAEHYNLTVAFRQSWVQHFKTVFFIPVALMGFHPVVFFVASQISTLYQFWVHTEAIGKLHPFIERYFGTPSNHRVHHGSQEKYLDKNFGAAFMIWDHLFGTFQYEEEKPVYGLTTPLENKTNPFVLNFHEYRDMLHDIKNSDGLKELLFFMFASPAKIYRHKAEKSVKQMNRLLSEKPLEREAGTVEKKAERWLKFAGILLVLILILTQLSPAQSSTKDTLPTPRSENMLFFLQRDPDANTVIYELNYNSEGKLDQRNPVKSSWIRYTEEGKCKELTLIENKFAYGVKCRPLGNEEFEIRLRAYQKMPLYLKRSADDNKYRIYIRDEGKDRLLKRVFVRVRGGSFWFPKVEYIDLITVNSASGMEFLKRINI